MPQAIHYRLTEAQRANVEAHIDLVRQVVSWMMRRGKLAELTPADAHQVGVFGLAKAVVRYRPVAKFRTYAWLKIHGAIREAMREQRSPKRQFVQIPEDWLEPVPRPEPRANEWLGQALLVLPGQERAVVRSIYAEELNWSQTAHQLGLHPTRVSQLHARALGRLRLWLIRSEVTTLPTEREERCPPTISQ